MFLIWIWLPYIILWDIILLLYWRIGIQVKAVVDAVQEVKEASFFLKGQQPYWFDLRSQAEELIALSQDVTQQIKTQGPKWINATIYGVKNEIETFTEGQISLVSEWSCEIMD